VFLYDRDGNTLVEVAVGQGPGGTDLHQDDVWLDGHRVARVVGEVGESCTDNDGDGYGFPGSAACTYPEEDCNDTNPAVNPGVLEVPDNGIDDDCDGLVDEACFVATVAFGSPLAREVVTLKAFRDRVLKHHVLGRAFVEFYYKHGPRAARFLEGRELLKTLVRGILYPAARVCQFALTAGPWEKAGVFLVTLLVPFGMVFLVAGVRRRRFAQYRKLLCVLLAMVFTFDTVMLGYLSAGGGVKEARAAVPPDGIYFYLNDQLGTPLKMVDSAGAVVWSADYLPFGQAAVDPASTIDNNWRFPGQYADVESGLHQNVMRSYSPALGRYTRPDPVNVATVQALDGSWSCDPTVSVSLLGVLRSPQLQNLYPYANSNPGTFVDSDGRIAAAYLIVLTLVTWVGACKEIAMDRAESTFPSSDKKQHCYASCFFNRCMLSSPALTVLGGILHELMHPRYGIGDAIRDIRADLYGLARSYSFSSCKESCDECKET